jgi:hypothetical protein
MASLPAPGDAIRIANALREHQRWSAFWDKFYAVWRAAEDDPDSDLYIESSSADTVVNYVTAHS